MEAPSTRRITSQAPPLFCCHIVPPFVDVALVLSSHRPWRKSLPTAAVGHVCDDCCRRSHDRYDDVAGSNGIGDTCNALLVLHSKWHDPTPQIKRWRQPTHHRRAAGINGRRITKRRQQQLLILPPLLMLRMLILLSLLLLLLVPMQHGNEQRFALRRFHFCFCCMLALSALVVMLFPDDDVVVVVVVVYC